MNTALCGFVGNVKQFKQYLLPLKKLAQCEEEVKILKEQLERLA